MDEFLNLEDFPLPVLKVHEVHKGFGKVERGPEYDYIHIWRDKYLRFVKSLIHEYAHLPQTSDVWLRERVVDLMQSTADVVPYHILPLVVDHEEYPVYELIAGEKLKYLRSARKHVKRRLVLNKVYGYNGLMNLFYTIVPVADPSNRVPGFEVTVLLILEDIYGQGIYRELFHKPLYECDFYVNSLILDQDKSSGGK